jgi:ADP-heptose:LPS heptosyltransferase
MFGHERARKHSLIRLKSIGDILFTLPAVNVIRENFPSAKIAFLTSKENAPLLQGFRARPGGAAQRQDA